MGGAGYASAPPTAVRLYGLVFVTETTFLSILLLINLLELINLKNKNDV